MTFCKNCPYEDISKGTIVPIKRKSPRIVIVWSRFVSKKTTKLLSLTSANKSEMIRVCQLLGYEIQEAHVTSAQKCVMIKDDQNEEKKEAMLKCCGRRLKKEIYTLNPEILVTFGNTPFEILKSSESARLHEAKILKLKKREFFWAALAHPEFFRYRPGMIRDAELILESIRIQRDLNWAPLFEDPGEDE